MDLEERPLARVFRTLRWVGVAPFDSLQPPCVSNAFVLYGRLMFLIYGGLYVLARVFELLDRNETSNTLASVVSLYVIGNTAVVCTIGHLYVGMFQSPKRMRHISQCLENLRKIRRQVGGIKQVDFTQRDVFLLFLGIQFLLMFINVYDILLWRDNHDNIVTLSYIFTLINTGYMVCGVVLMPFIAVAMTVSLSFRAINERLEELIIHGQSLLRKRIGNNNLNAANFKRYFLTDLKIPVATINNAIDKLGNVANHNDGKFELSHEKLRSLTWAYVRTCEVVHQQNESEKVVLALALVDIVVNLIVTVYYMMSSLQETNSNFVPIATSTLIWVVIDVCRGMLLVSPSHAISMELLRSRLLLSKLMSTVWCTSDPLLTELEVFLLQLSLNQPSYVSLGMFPLTVHVGASLSQVGERQMSNAAERGGRLCLFVARAVLSLVLQALNGTPQSEMMAICATYQVVIQGLSD